ncbi:MAG TPA: SIS domain-containing protein [Gaiellales bacterium]|nr:SIS domain-containing protein [Gaiellales bacterium]
MTDDRSWLTDEYPELRDGPPWVMEEMILAERDLPTAILEGAGEETAQVAAAIRDAVALSAPIVVTGCGTSEHGAMAVAALIADAMPGAWVEAREALDATVRPRAGGLCIGISHDGGTRATRLALESAKKAGAVTAAVTAHPATSVPEAADYVVVTPFHDRSWCHTVAYVSAIVAGAGIAGSGVPAARLTDAIDTAVAARPRIADAARSIHDGRRILTAGLGADFVTARELALKIEEGARISANAHRLETTLHGHLAGCDAESTALVRVALDPGGGTLAAERGADLDAALGVIGIPSVVLGEPLGLAPAASVAEALISGAVGLQLLTLELAHAAGTNPDLIRREERAYREAAAAAERSDG